MVNEAGTLFGLSPRCDLARFAIMSITALASVAAASSQSIAVGWGSDVGCTPIHDSTQMFVDIDGYQNATAVVLADGSVQVFGANTNVLGQFDVFTRYPGLQLVRDAVEVGIGAGHVVVRSASGAVSCFGSDQYGQVTLPADLGAAMTVGAFGTSSFAIRTDGGVRLWGNLPVELTPHGPDGLGAVRSLACGGSYAVAVTDDGGVVAWGRKSWSSATPVAQPPIPITDGWKAAAGLDRCFVLRESGVVYEWFASGGSGAPVLPAFPGVPILDVDADLDGACARFSSGWVGTTGIVSSPPLPPPWGPNFVDAAAGVFRFVGVTSDGVLASAGDGPGSAPQYPAGVKSPKVVSHGREWCLAVNDDGTIVAWGSAGAVQLQVPDLPRPAITAAAGEAHGVGVLDDGSVVAWGDGAWGATEVPDDLPPISAVAAGDGFCVALGEDGSIHAWGRNDEGQASPPGDPVPATAVSAGLKHAAALLADGRILCWGFGSAAQCEVVDGLGPVRRVACGGDASAALLEDGSIKTWGALGSHDYAPDTGLVDIQVVSTEDPTFFSYPSSVFSLDVDGDVHRRTDSGESLVHQGVQSFGTSCRTGLALIIRDEDCADLDGDGVVGGAELAAVLGAWGTDGTGAGGGSSGQGADFDGSGVVDGADLLIVLSQYGECGP